MTEFVKVSEVFRLLFEVMLPQSLDRWIYFLGLYYLKCSIRHWTLQRRKHHLEPPKVYLGLIKNKVNQNVVHAFTSRLLLVDL